MQVLFYNSPLAWGRKLSQDFLFYKMRLQNPKLINNLIPIYSVSPNLENKLYYIHQKIIVNMKRIGNKCDFSIQLVAKALPLFCQRAKTRHMPLVLVPKLLGRKLAELLLILPFMIYDNGCGGRRSHLHLLGSFFVYGFRHCRGL